MCRHAESTDTDFSPMSETVVLAYHFPKLVLILGRIGFLLSEFETPLEHTAFIEGSVVKCQLARAAPSPTGRCLMRTNAIKDPAVLAISSGDTNALLRIMFGDVPRGVVCELPHSLGILFTASRVSPPRTGRSQDM